MDTQYIQGFAHLANYHVAKCYKLQTPILSETNSQSITPFHKMYCGHLEILHVQLHSQIQHIIPLSS